MRPSASSSVAPKLVTLPGPSLIAAGVAILTLAVLWPVVPATTGAALVALGATGEVVNRFRRTSWFQSVLAAHLFVYVSLYLLFVGEVTHAAMSGPQDGLSFLQGIDLGVSAAVLALAVRVGVGSLIEDAAGR